MKTKSFIQILFLSFVSFLFISCGSSSGRSTTTIDSTELAKYLGTFLVEETETNSTVVKRNGVEVSNDSSTNENSDNHTITNDATKKCDMLEDDSVFTYVGEGTYPVTYDCTFEGLDATITLSFDSASKKFTIEVKVKKQAVEEEGITNATAEGNYTSTVTFAADFNSYTGTSSGGLTYGGNENGDTISFEINFSGSFTGTRQ